MVAFKGCEVTVEVNGQALPEYDGGAEELQDFDQRQASKTVTRYIEAVSGSTFTISCNHHGPLPRDPKVEGLAWHLQIDGVIVRGFYSTTHPYRGHLNNVEVISKDGKCHDREFMFADIEIDDSDGTPSSEFSCIKERAAKLGVIEVIVRRVRSSKLHWNPESLGMDAVERMEGLKSVPEKALKGDAKSQVTRLGPPKPADIKQKRDCDYIDTWEDPFLRFVFKYRSRKALEALRIIQPLEERPLEQLNAEQLRELLQRQRAQAQAENLSLQTQIKPEVKPIIKRERESGPEPDHAGGRDSDVEVITPPARLAKRQRPPEVIMID